MTGPSLLDVALRNVHTTSLGVLETCGNMAQNVGDRLQLSAFRPPLTASEAIALDGKVCVVTGGNAGIGLATAEALAKRGAHVVLACRSKARGMAAAQALQQRCVPVPGCGPSRVEFMEVDLASLNSVRSFCKAFNARKLPLHLLVANGGVMSPAARIQTKDGLEMQFQVNFLSHWLMAHLLLAEQRERRSKQWRRSPQQQQQQQQQQDQEQALVALASSVNSSSSSSSSSSNCTRAPLATVSSRTKHSSWSLRAAPLGANGWDSAAVAFSSAAAKAGDLIWGVNPYTALPTGLLAAEGGGPVSRAHGLREGLLGMGCPDPAVLDLDGKSTAARSGCCSGSTWSSSNSVFSGMQGNSSIRVPAKRDGVGNKEVTNNSAAITQKFGLHDNSTRVVMLSSLTHHTGILNWDDMQSERKYDPFTSYALSKLANTITAVELQRRFEKASQSPEGCAWGSDSAVSAHPGIVNTSLATDFFKSQGLAQAVPALAPFIHSFVDGLGEAAMRSTRNSAAVMLYAALAPTQEVGGRYIVDGRTGKPAAEAMDSGRATELWSMASQLTGLDIHPSLR